jgi:hypothetical protein
VPHFSDKHHDDLDRTLRLMREAGWVLSYSLAEDNVSVAWTDRGEAALAVLRKLGLELGLDRDPTIAPTTFWLAINFGPDVAEG